jgi:hypothetical protein
MTAESCERRLDPWKLCRMMRVENSAGFLLMSRPDEYAAAINAS